MKDVTIQLVTERTLASAVIRYFTWSDYSHVDFVLDSGELLGARMDGGVAVRPPNYANFTKKLRLVTTLPNGAVRDLYDWLDKQVGKPYDRTGIINFFKPEGQRRDWKADDSWWCSELVAGGFDHIGYSLFNSINPDRITPRDLMLSLRLRNALVLNESPLPVLTNVDAKAVTA